jgi:hypothetical protein
VTVPAQSEVSVAQLVRRTGAKHTGTPALMLTAQRRLRPARAAAAAAVALAAFMISCTSARAEGFVQIDTVAGGARTVDLSSLGTPDVPSASYGTVASPGGAPHTVTVTSGYSLLKLFKDAKLPLTFRSAEILAPQGPPVVLTNPQATSPAAYSSGGGPPVVWADGAGTHFLVPSTPSGNTNAGETFTGQGGTITIQLHNGPPLSVGISGPVKAFVGKPVKFTSSVYGGTATQFQWTFGDGSLASDAAPSHTFAALGTYDVYLRVTGGTDSVGVSSVIPVVVGNAPPPRPSVGTGTGGNGTGSGGSGAGAGAGTGAGSASTSTTPGSAPTVAPTHHRPAKRPAHRRTRQPPRPVGPVVSGIAISYIATPASATGGSSGGTAGAARAAHLAATAKGLREGMWIWLGVLLALFGGGLLELRGSWRTAPAPAPTMAEAP